MQRHVPGAPCRLAGKGVPRQAGARGSPCSGKRLLYGCSTGEPSRTAPSTRKYKIRFENPPVAQHLRGPQVPEPLRRAATALCLAASHTPSIPPASSASLLHPQHPSRILGIPPAPSASLLHPQHPSCTPGIPPASLASLPHPRHPSHSPSNPPTPHPSTGMWSPSQRALSLPRRELLGRGRRCCQEPPGPGLSEELWGRGRGMPVLPPRRDLCRGVCSLCCLQRPAVTRLWWAFGMPSPGKLAPKHSFQTRLCK